MKIRQPIVTFLGHVDHGKTKILDNIRYSFFASNEEGGITQHITATETTYEEISKKCKNILTKEKINIPGLLFIDTPGHQSFGNLRESGNILSDISILVIDIMEGIKEQTIDSIKLLKKNKTPFIIALNKIDKIDGWNSEKNRPFINSELAQKNSSKESLNTKIYKIISELSLHNVYASKYTEIENFAKNIAIVPLSGISGEGIPDLLTIIIGLAQRFLINKLSQKEDLTEGTIIERKEEKGLGSVFDIILFSGTIKVNDLISINVNGKEKITKIKSIFKRNIDYSKKNYIFLKELNSSSCAKILCKNIENIPPISNFKTIKNISKENKKEDTMNIYNNSKLDDDGIIIKADTVGSLEAFLTEGKKLEIPIKKGEIGEITKRDVAEASLTKIDHYKIILGFNVLTQNDAFNESEKFNVKILSDKVLYKLLNKFLKVTEEIKKKNIEKTKLKYLFPSKFTILPNHIFRLAKPAIVGIKVLAGKLLQNQIVINIEGNTIGKIKTIHKENKTIKEAIPGNEVSISIDNAVAKKQIKENEIFYTDLDLTAAKQLTKLELEKEEKELLETLIQIKKRKNPLWFF